MRHFELVVLGGGPAGITLAKRLGKKFSMAVIRPEDHSLIYCAMPYVIEGILPLEKTFKKDSLVTESGAELIRGKAVEADFENKSVLLEDETRIGWDRLVVATGAEPLVPPLKGVDFPNVGVFKSEGDLRSRIDHISSGMKRAVVVGAGAIGIELASALARKGVETHLVERENRVLGAMMDEDMTSKLHHEVAKEGVFLHLGKAVEEIRGSGGAEEVLLSGGETLSLSEPDACFADVAPGAVIFAVGMRASVDLFKNGPLALGRDGIIVNGKMETSLPGVYAVGDCVQFSSAVTGNPIPGKLATNAVPMAKVPAANLCGENRSYGGFYNGAATKIGDLYAGGSGITAAFAEKNGIPTISGVASLTTAFPIMPNAKEITLKLVASKETGRIIGGQIVGGEPVTDKVDVLSTMLRSQWTAEDVLDFSYSSQPWQSFFPADNLFVAAAEKLSASM